MEAADLQSRTVKPLKGHQRGTYVYQDIQYECLYSRGVHIIEPSIRRGVTVLAHHFS